MSKSTTTTESSVPHPEKKIHGRWMVRARHYPGWADPDCAACSGTGTEPWEFLVCDECFISDEDAGTEEEE